MLRARSHLGKYRIRRCIGHGGYADVYEADDTVEGIRVALKVPAGDFQDDETVEAFRREVRLTARLAHPNILPIKNAEILDGRLVVAYPLGDGTLRDRLSRRTSVARCLDYGEQILGALAHAHEAGVIHCDVKPENVIMFGDDTVRLADFGIAKAATRTVQAAGTGSVGYMSPEQAMGRPSRRSDVFSAAMVIYRMLTGQLPAWPLRWPLPGAERIKRLGPELAAFLRRGLEIDPARRFRDAPHMLAAYRRVRRQVEARVRRATRTANVPARTRGADWRSIRGRQYRRRYGAHLRHDGDCPSCGEPIDERMQVCPWCGTRRTEHDGSSRLPGRCERCNRGVKLDWKYCGWCWGGAIGPVSDRTYTDRAYRRRCPNDSCDRRELLPFMRYCPWCRSKVRAGWKLGGSRTRCDRCGSGVARGFWAHCAWCGHGVEST